MTIFFGVFLCLSKMLFPSLEKIAVARNKQIFSQKMYVKKVEQDIKMHEKYIFDNLHTKENNILFLYKQINNNVFYKNQSKYKYLKDTIKNNYIKILQSITKEEKIVKSNLFRHTCKMTSQINKKLHTTSQY
jgi:hypothetical protein